MFTVTEFLRQHPTKEDVKNPVILIPTFENAVYLQGCINQLEKLGLTRYLVLDGGSKGKQMEDILAKLRAQGRAIDLEGNPGPRFFFDNKVFFESLPEIFCVTDPDLEFNPDLPANFLEDFFRLSEELKEGKVGFALSLEGNLSEQEFFFGKRWVTVREWESQFWRERIPNALDLPAYRAQIDTTFAMYNKKFVRKRGFFSGVRVAGPYTAKHLPWYDDSVGNDVASREIRHRPHSNWDAELSRRNERLALEYAYSKISALEQSLSWRITAPLREIQRFLSRFGKIFRNWNGKLH